MVRAGKVFIVKEEVDLGTLAAKLKGFRSEEEVEVGGKKIPLVTEVVEVSMEGEEVRGTFSQDQLLEVFHRGTVVPMPKTMEAPFLFARDKSRILLIVLEKKLRANNIANQLSKILFIATGRIVEAHIPPDVFKKFHEENFEDTKVIFFDNVDIPNVTKLSLYGSGLADTSLYADYLGHGDIWYTVIKAKRYGLIVGVTRNAVVTLFSRVERKDFLEYVRREIFPLIP